jgi:phosphatidylinositol 4-kinase type 2
VWDDELEIAEETFQEAILSPAPASPKPSIISVPLPRRTRSQSSSSEFPPPIRRSSTDASGAPRPVPFAAKFQRVHPGTTGVTVLEHLERLDAVEASLQRLGGAEEDDEEAVEIDVGVSSSKPVQVPVVASSSNIPTSPFSPPGSPLATVHEVSSSASSIAEEDLAAMSKSTSYVEGLPHRNSRQTGAGNRADWIQPPDASQKRTVIVEVRPAILLGAAYNAKHLRSYRIAQINPPPLVTIERSHPNASFQLHRPLLQLRPLPHFVETAVSQRRTLLRYDVQQRTCHSFS